MIILGGLIADRADRLSPGVRGKRMFLMPFPIFMVFAFFGEAVTYLCVFLSTQLGLEVRHGLEESLDDRLPLLGTAVKVIQSAVKKRFYLCL